MTKRCCRNWLVVGAILGFLVPITNLLVYQLVVVRAYKHVTTSEQYFQVFKHLHYPILQMRLISWPSSILLLGTAGNEGSPGSYLTMALSILVNILLYCFVGYLLWGISQAIAKIKGKWRSN